MFDERHPFIVRFDEVFHPEYPLSSKALWRTLPTEELVRIIRNAFSPFYDEVRKAYLEELLAYQVLLKDHLEATKIPPKQFSAAELVVRFITRQPVKAPDPPPPPSMPLCPSYETVFGEILQDACRFVEELHSLVREHKQRTEQNRIDLEQFARRMKEVKQALRVDLSQTR